MDKNLQARVDALAAQSAALDKAIADRASVRKKMTDDYTAACSAFDAETAVMVEKGNGLKSLASDAGLAASAVSEAESAMAKKEQLLLTKESALAVREAELAACEVAVEEREKAAPVIAPVEEPNKK